MTATTKVAKKKLVTSDVPMSESIIPKIKDPWTAEQCVAELQRLVKAEPEKVISRNYFRVHSVIAESVWNVHFGTFLEFKRQAGIVLTRQQHSHERSIAKHASVDHYRRLNAERADWEGKYLRENKARFKTVLACSDLHDKEVDPFFMRVLIDTAYRAQPDIIVLNGDIFDLPEFGKYLVDPREWDVVGRIKFVHTNILAPLRKACPNSQIDFTEGNHEARLLRMLADATPALRAVLSDLHGMTVGKLLGLDEYEVNYIAKLDLAAFTKKDFQQELTKNYKIYWHVLLAHHFPHARSMGLPGFNGHHHTHIVWPGFNPVTGPFEWHQLGCGHRRDASYCEGEKWHLGFSLINVDTQKKTTSFDYVPVGDFAVSGGKWYHREAAEK